MNREEFFYLLPYLFSLALSLSIFVYTWRHRQVRGARIYSWFVGGQTLTILGFIFELVTPDLQTKILWDKFQWLTDSFLVFVPFLIFSIQFSEYKLRYPRLTWGLWLSIPILFIVILLTDNLHHLIYLNPHLSTDYPFPDLQYSFTFVVYIYALAYVYSVNFYGISLLVRRAIQPHNLYRSQYWTIAAGFFIPLALSIFSLANIKITQQRDISPFSFALGNLIVAWGLFRYGLFDIVPIARERIVENMGDPVIVLDNRNRIVDINAAALGMIKKQGSEVIGRNSSVAFAKWPVVVELLENYGEQRKEVSMKHEDNTVFFDISISTILNRRQEPAGRIVVARDITRHKMLEVGYRMLSEELEQRVEERTKELQASAARYRAVVENQTEFIVRWKPDGTRTFVNEAYCRYFDITIEQAISSSFISQVVIEDRAAVEEKISRLSSGTVNSQTNIHRVIKPDGSIGWQEWTDSVMRNESGQVLELQSVGRDITERKLAEEALRESEAIYRKAIEVAGAVPYRQSYPGKDFHIDYDFIGDGIRQITGYGPEEFHEDLWDSLVQESRLAGELAQYSWREAVHRVRTGASPIWQCEHRIRARNGEIRWVYEAAVELRDKDGQSRGSIGLFQDITERKRAEANLAEAYDTTLEGWAKALELRDKETEGHSRRVTETTLALARAMGFSEEELVHIRRGSILHDIGKMGIPDDILRKHGPLTDEERIIVQKHPDTAYELLKRIAYLERSLEIPYCHHEKWDGSGYPRGLKGDEIPLAARIFAVADVWDALSSDRPYRNAWNKEQVTEYLMNESGKHFDPHVISAFLPMVEKGEI